MGAVGPQILALDLGTSGMKAGLVGVDGTVTGWASQDVRLTILPGGGAEQRPGDWWQAVATVAARLRAEHPEYWAAVVGICTSAQGEGTIPLGADLEPLHDCVLWMDMRGRGNLLGQFGAPLGGRAGVAGMRADQVARWVRYTGGMPSPTGKDPASHMLWFRDEHPEIYERTRVFVNVLDYLNLKLTGRVVATVDSILTSWVTDNRRPDAVAYHPGLLARCGIDADKFPEIVACSAVVGPLSESAARLLGLPTSVQVVAGAVDNSAAAVGAGTVGMGEPHLYLGTSSWIAAHVPAKKTDVRHSIAALPCALPDRYLLTALQSVAGGNLTWLGNQILRHDDPLVLAHPEGSYGVLDDLLAQSPPGAHGAIYLPWIYGERAPVDDPSLRAGMVNVGLRTTREDLVRAVFEGVAYNTRWLLGPVESFTGRPTQTLPVAGGGARSSHWCQTFADVMGVAIHRLADPVKVNARGAGWIGAAGLGLLAFDDVSGSAKVDREFLPREAHRSVHDEGYATFRELHRRLAPVYRRLGRRGHDVHDLGLLHGAAPGAS